MRGGDSQRERGGSEVRIGGIVGIVAVVAAAAPVGTAIVVADAVSKGARVVFVDEDIVGTAGRYPRLKGDGPFHFHGQKQCPLVIFSFDVPPIQGIPPLLVQDALRPLSVGQSSHPSPGRDANILVAVRFVEFSKGVGGILG